MRRSAGVPHRVHLPGPEQTRALHREERSADDAHPQRRHSRLFRRSRRSSSVVGCRPMRETGCCTGRKHLEHRRNSRLRQLRQGESSIGDKVRRLLCSRRPRASAEEAEFACSKCLPDHCNIHTAVSSRPDSVHCTWGGSVAPDNCDYHAVCNPAGGVAAV